MTFRSRGPGMVRRGTDRRTIAVTPASHNNPKYCSDYFTSNPGKPPITCPESNSFTVQNARETIVGGWQRSDLIDINVIKFYLHKVLETDTQTLLEDWSSFGVVIGTAGTIVTPLSLFASKTVTMNEAKFTKTDLDLGEKDDDWILLVICTIQRLNQSNDTDTEYTDRLKAKLTDLCGGMTNKFTFRISENKYSSWNQDGTFMKLIAGIDMFYNRFPKSPRAKIRFGSITSRLKDCSILNSLVHIMTTTESSLTDIKCWIFTKEVGREFDIVYRPGQEIDDSYSYMPYMSDMRLSTRSPYSATNCTNLHNWLHVIGSYLGTKRSRDARMPSPIKSSIQTNGALFAFAVRASPYMERYLSFDNEEEQAEFTGENIDLTKSNEAFPDTPDGALWFQWYIDNGKSLGKEIPLCVNRIAADCGIVRAGTVGKFLRANPLRVPPL